MVTPRKRLADSLRTWFKGGEVGCNRICEMENAPEEVKAYVKHWFEKSRPHMEVLADRIENEDWST